MKYVIVGNSNYAKMLYEYIADNEKNCICAFTAEKEYIDSTQIYGLDVISLENIVEYYPPGEVKLLLGVGYTQMNDVKEKLYRKYKLKGYQFATYIHPSAVVPREMDMGEGNIIFEGTIIQKGCEIGCGNVFFARTLIAHDCKVGNFNSFSCASIAGNVTVKNKCFIGMGAVIGENITIENQVFIGANAYINCDLKEKRVALGVKAKIIDKEISKSIL